MARCHLEAFPGTFMTLMGERWLEALYGFYLDQSRGVCIVAADEGGNVVGLAVGGDPGIRDKFLRYALYRYPHLIAAGFFRAALVRQVLIGEVTRRFTGSASVAVASEDFDPRHAPVGNLLSIGIVPHARGSGIARALLRRFESECATRGYRSLKLSVLRSNSRAIGFYTKLGWQEVGGAGESARFVMFLEERGASIETCGVS